MADPRHAGDLALRESVTVAMAAHGARFQDVILWGRPEDADHLLWLGFAPEWRRGGLAIARFEGCPLSVRFPPESVLTDADVLALGWAPARDVTHRYELSRAQRAPDGARILTFLQSCGAVWLRFEREEISCAGADSERRLVVREVRATPRIECRVQRADPVD
jgi:hypothetical protein